MDGFLPLISECGIAITKQINSCTNTSLKELDLGRCRIGAVGAKALAAALSGGSCGLTKLVLSGNKIKDEGAIAIGGNFWRCARWAAMRPALARCGLLLPVCRLWLIACPT